MPAQQPESAASKLQRCEHASRECSKHVVKPLRVHVYGCVTDWMDG